MIDSVYLRGNSADDRDMGHKNVVGAVGIGPDESEGSVGGNRRGWGERIYGGRSISISRELIHGTTYHINDN